MCSRRGTVGAQCGVRDRSFPHDKGGRLEALILGLNLAHEARARGARLGGGAACLAGGPVELLARRASVERGSWYRALVLYTRVFITPIYLYTLYTTTSEPLL